MMGISVILAAVVAWFPFAWAQTGAGNSAMIRGTVYDAAHAPTANARVIVVSGSDRQETRTDAKGNFYFLSVAVGDYVILAAREGVNPCDETSQPASELSAGMEYSVDVTLKPCS